MVWARGRSVGRQKISRRADRKLVLAEFVQRMLDDCGASAPCSRMPLMCAIDVSGGLVRGQCVGRRKGDLCSQLIDGAAWLGQVIDTLHMDADSTETMRQLLCKTIQSFVS